eukprot:624107-Hanusia_phi.AAC.1
MTIGSSESSETETQSPGTPGPAGPGGRRADSVGLRRHRPTFMITQLDTVTAPRRAARPEELDSEFQVRAEPGPPVNFISEIDIQPAVYGDRARRRDRAEAVTATRSHRVQSEWAWALRALLRPGSTNLT